ncbi:zinc finger protein with KRAB and SCAN domains 3-like [Pteropus alecto]|uniref:zinc finger protein with KRAB and SCAN domains 3-like n=1 Tax=Pteropus alecto TaxID=9402 RepID=UPI0007687733|nr:zinc finger protein with KRAB and SCAN domains 3-like [Pteropus alecto]
MHSKEQILLLLALEQFLAILPHEPQDSHLGSGEEVDLVLEGKDIFWGEMAPPPPAQDSPCIINFSHLNPSSNVGLGSNTAPSQCLYLAFQRNRGDQTIL